MKKGYFVSGTDTGIGKTVTSAILLEAVTQQQSLRQDQKQECGYFKPVQTGDDSDTRTVQSLCNAFVSPPVYTFSDPVAPGQAAEKEGQKIDLSVIKKAWESLPERFWIVEGAGGLLVPLNRTACIIDLIQALELPLILVASTRLGTMNHTLLSVEAAKRRGIEIKGLVFVGEDQPEVVGWITHFCQLPVLAQIPKLSQVNQNEIFRNASQWVRDGLL